MATVARGLQDGCKVVELFLGEPGKRKCLYTFLLVRKFPSCLSQRKSYIPLFDVSNIFLAFRLVTMHDINIMQCNRPKCRKILLTSKRGI